MNKPLLPKVAVNGEEISAADIAAEAQNHAAPRGKPGIAWRSAARALAIRKLMLQEAMRQGLAADPQEVSPGRFETEEEALVRDIMDQSIAPDHPSEADVKQAYLASPQQFRAPSLYEPAHILFAIDPSQEDGRAQALAKAKAALETLAKSPAQFGKLAGELSQCQSASIGGKLGQISPGDTVPEFEAAMQCLDVGQMSPEPVESQYGFHIIRLDAKAEGNVLPFEAVQEHISEALEKSAWAHAAKRFTSDLIENSEITGISFE